MPGKPAPGPRGTLSSLRELRSRPLEYFQELIAKYGDVVRIPIGFQHVYLLDNPEHIKRVLVDNCDNYHKDPRFKKATRGGLGNGLVTSEDEFWKKQRRMMQPGFHRQRVAGFGAFMIESIDQMMKEWDAQAPKIEVSKSFSALTSKIVGRTMFGTDLGDDDNEMAEAVAHANSYAYDQINSLVIIESLPTPGRIRFNRVIRRLHAMVDRIIDSHRRGETSHSDLLAMLLEARDEDTGEAMSFTQVRDEILTFYIAGHETTATGLTWLFSLLSQHPEVERGIRDEVAAVIGDGVPTVESLSKLAYTTTVIQESMRLYPPAWLLSRAAIEDDVMGEFRLAAGSPVFLCPYTTHRRRDCWQNPEVFDPGNFAPEKVTARHKFAYYPFGGGRRLCIGAAIAMMQIQLVVVMLVRSYRLKLLPEAAIRATPAITLRPRDPLVMTLERA